MKRTPLKRKTRLRRTVRPRRRYGGGRQWGKVRRWVQHRADGWCEAQVDGVCTRVGSHAHHILPRSAGGSDDMGNLLWTCPSCHHHIHLHPAESYARGWLRKRAS